MSTPDQVIGGRYEVVEHIARGGMAEVYLGRDTLLDRPVALKILFRELSVDPSFVERFRREAQAAAGLNHPNVVSVYDWGEEDGTYFMVMEHVEGRSLAQVIRQRGAVPPERAAEIGADVAAALAFAHRSGMIHRDVKPGNVLIGRDGIVKVTDFGIARALDVDEDLTRTGSVMGTATYFSPEQAQGQALDERSDVYSLGVVLYELVTGRAPFTGDNPMAIAYKHVREEPVPPRQVDESIPPALEAIILRALAKDRDTRYDSADELRADLLRFRQGRKVLATAPLAGPQTMVADALPATSVQPAAAMGAAGVYAGGPATGAVDAYEAERRERRTGAYVALLLAMLGALAVLLFLIYRSMVDTGPATATVPSVLGKPYEQAAQEIRDAGFDPFREDVPNDEQPAGTVFDQDPDGNTKHPEGARVTLRVSSGATPVPVPNVVGDPFDDAEDELRLAGFTVRRIDEPQADIPRDEVFAQTPEGGTEAPKGSEVVLRVSAGRGDVTVPNLAGRTYQEAEDALFELGLRATRKEQPSTADQEGKVLTTNPQAGTRVERGARVEVVVGSGPETVTVPSVVGRSEAEARRQLEAAGFKVTMREQTVTDPSDNGVVVDQSPDGGQEATKGSTVTIVVGRAVARPSSTSTTSTTAGL